MLLAEKQVIQQQALDQRLAELAQIKALIREWTGLYGDPRYGHHRAVFLDSDRVLKVPRDKDGCQANLREASCQDGNIHLARCRLLPQFAFPVLEMERVTPTSLPPALLPAWVRRIDCAQIGWTADNRLVAYDI